MSDRLLWSFVLGFVAALPTGFVFGELFVAWRRVKRSKQVEAELLQRLTLVPAQPRGEPMPLSIFAACNCAACTARRAGGWKQ